MNSKKKIWIAVGVVSVLVLFVVVAVINNRNEAAQTSAAPKNALPVQVEAAKKDDIISIVTTKGIVEAEKKESIYMNTAAKVEDVLVEVGDKVKVGQVLIQYDQQSKESLEDQLEEAKMNLRTAEINLETFHLPASNEEINQTRSGISQAEKLQLDAESALKQADITIEQLTRNIEDKRKSLETKEILYKEGAISLLDLDQVKEELISLEERLETSLIQKQVSALSLANVKEQVKVAKDSHNSTLNKLQDPKVKNQIKIQENQIQLSKMRVQQLEKQLEDLVLETKSTMDGVVVGLNVEKGSAVNPSLPVAQVDDLEQLIIKVDVSEFDAPQIQVGQEVQITGDSLGDITYTGVVKKVAPTAVTKRTTTGEEVVVEVEIGISDKNTLLKPGYSIEAEIVTSDKQDVVVVPIVATVKEKDGSYVVYIVNEDFTVSKRTVQLGGYSNLYVEVTNVEEGEKVITNPSARLAEGITVRPLENNKTGDNNDNN